MSRPTPDGTPRAWSDALDQMEEVARRGDDSSPAFPNVTAIESAREGIDAMTRAGLVPVVIAPSPDEGVSVSFVQGDRYGTVEFYNGGEIAAVVSDRSATPEAWMVERTAEGLIATAQRILAFLERPA